MYFETFVMFIVKFNHKACKYNEINLMSLDKSYLKLYVLMQVGFLCSVYTYFGYTDLSIDYLYKNYRNALFINQIWFLEFILRSGFIIEILANFLIFARLLTYPFSKLFYVWGNYFEYIIYNIQELINKYRKNNYGLKT